MMILLTISAGSYTRLIIADQHAVDERIQLERILGNLKESGKVAKPIHLAFTRKEQDQVYVKLDYLSYWGFGLFIDGTGVKITRVPEVIKTRFVQQPDLLKSVVLSITTANVGEIVPEALMEVCKSVACRSAIMFGTVLNLVACRELMTGLRDCEHPFICAHGRPGIVPIAEFEC
jgi:DNA mismatch repair protein MLH3